MALSKIERRLLDGIAERVNQDGGQISIEVCLPNVRGFRKIKIQEVYGANNGARTWIANNLDSDTIPSQIKDLTDYLIGQGVTRSDLKAAKVHKRS